MAAILYDTYGWYNLILCLENALPPIFSDYGNLCHQLCLQLSLSDTCQIWSWCWQSMAYFSDCQAPCTQPIVLSPLCFPKQLGSYGKYEIKSRVSSHLWKRKQSIRVSQLIISFNEPYEISAGWRKKIWINCSGKLSTICDTSHRFDLLKRIQRL